jgi:hypothetical protein
MRGNEKTVPVKDFFKWLWGDVGIRFHLEYHRGILTYFVIQLECLINDEWQGIIRYDNSHGFCHKDTIYPDGSQSKEDLSHLTVKQVVQMARLDIESRWEFYVQRYKEWLSKC